MKFGDILKSLLSEQGISQSFLAEKIGFSQRAISRWVNGESEPSESAIRKTAEFFGVSTDFMVGRTDEFGSSIVTDADRAAGWIDTTRVSVTPIEDDMLQLFRKIGKKYGKDSQKAAIAMLENMLGLK